ncbi:MAG: hypothetical protein Q8936_21895 [Bacillota bacterium]|nr:hypothetical protein [Bacillota bacterium]
MKKIMVILFTLLFMASIPTIVARADSSQLLIQKVSTEPEIVEPGQQFKLKFSLKNSTDYNIKEISIKLAGLEGKNALGGFSPVNSTNEVYYDKLSGGDTTELSLDMISDPQLKTGNYNMVVNISYKYDGNLIQDTKVVGIVLNNKPELTITSVDYNNDNEDTKDVKVGFVNAGQGVLNEVIAKVTVGDKQYSKYIGKLESGDEDSYEVKLPFSNDINGKIELSYKDEMNRDGSISKDLNIKKDVKQEVKKADTSKGFFSSIGSFFKRLFGLGD